MKFLATPVKASELKPGDLFSNAPQAYWDKVADHGSVGEKVYIRTAEPCPQDQADDVIQRITIEP